MSAMEIPVTDLSWLVASFTEKVPGVANTVVVSSDGLLLAMSNGLDRVSGDQLAAVASGITSLTNGGSACFDGGTVNQVIVEMERGYLFVTSISDGSCLAVLAAPGCDIGLIGYEMALLVSRVGDALTPAMRAELQAALPL